MHVVEKDFGYPVCHLVSGKDSVGALDRQDVWGAAVIEWLMGEPDQALQTLLERAVPASSFPASPLTTSATPVQQVIYVPP